LEARREQIVLYKIRAGRIESIYVCLKRGSR
jgi:hypothetical protein